MELSELRQVLQIILSSSWSGPVISQLGKERPKEPLHEPISAFHFEQELVRSRNQPIYKRRAKGASATLGRRWQGPVIFKLGKEGPKEAAS